MNETCFDCNNSQDGTATYRKFFGRKYGWRPICTYCAADAPRHRVRRDDGSTITGNLRAELAEWGR